MKKHWSRINFLLRHQVYLRVLPVVVLSVAILGVFSMVVFERDALNRANSNQQYEMSDLSHRFAEKLGGAATMAELLRTRLELGSPGLDDGAVARQLLTIPHLSGAALVDMDQPELIDIQLQPALDTPHNREVFAQWSRSCPVEGADVASQNGSALTGGILMDSGPGHAVWGLRPVFLDGAMGADGVISHQSPHLPLLVRHQDSPGGKALLLLLNTPAFMDPESMPDWICILLEDGRELFRRDVGGSGFLADLNGKDLVALAGSMDMERGRLFHRWRNPWLVSAADSKRFPGVKLVLARPASDLQHLLARYMAFVVGVALLALLGATMGVMRVMERLSQRLGDLSENMAGMAQGEYSRRMHDERWDEIGQLVGYFNMMAVSLDEAHREVRQKTLHLRSALENMRVLDQAKDDFLVLISHEVRTPLTAIMGGVDFLRSRLDQASEPQRQVLDELNVGEVVGIIQSSGTRLGGFMTDAIQMTAVQSRNRKVELKVTPAADVVGQGLDGIRAEAEARSIRVENQLEDSVWSLLGDPEMLGVALGKILDNALKHNRDGGRILVREVWEVPGQGAPGDLLTAESRQILEGLPTYSRFEEEDVRWRLIEIFNNGEPIPEERRQALFRKFELVGRIEHHSKGSGLSLPIAQGALACQGGRILLHSDGRDGNSFYLLLPTLLDNEYVEEALASSLWDDAGQGLGRGAGDEEVGEVADGAGLEVEVDDAGVPAAGGVDKAGGGVDRTGGSDHQEEVTVGSRRE